MTRAYTPEHLYADPVTAEIQAANFAALEKIALDPPEYPQEETADLHLRALGLPKPSILFISEHDLSKVDAVDPIITHFLLDRTAEYFTAVGSTVVLTDGKEDIDLSLRRAILHSNIKGTARTRAIRIGDGSKVAPSDTGLFHTMNGENDPAAERGVFLETGLQCALERDITLAAASPEEESTVLHSIGYPNMAAQCVRTLVCKDPSLLDTMLHARSTFDLAAQEHLKSELDRVMGEGFYDTIMQVRNDRHSFTTAKAFTLQRSAEHRADKRVRVDSFRLVLQKVVQEYQTA